ncbi:hypothetical protein Pedsa_1919 [Pseudopedobacter saltans DSM 12145]|uniref:TonB-dependent receptor n=1 Tax=Pseudopedobacter saltans (strain ATCC 51119 / DSM 12145 / JCM 21818 / CCUG 39354 / LMG 10337 / NBRC 100064 / NCIMB 13643) TaxID=762903 RepID=F0S9C2_PSESL|nr:TonB-dependent receptor [Pseudopedobacter saltans]ADY52472.1 hypothetical protein Pedsa_1919 [Pseudopedobacter saltans DSM 12145]
MKLSYNLNRYLLLCLLGVNTSLFAQVKTEEKKPQEEKPKAAVTEEVEVVRSYKPILADAVKIRRNPDLNEKKVFNPKVKYNPIDKKLELDSEIGALEAQKLIKQDEETLYNNFAKFGMGNLGSTLGALHIGTDRDEALQAGFNFNHWANSNGTLNKQKMSEQSIGAYGRSIGDNIVLDGKLNYNRRSNYFYGVNPEDANFNLDPKKQRFNLFEGDGLIYNRIDPNDMDKFAYAAKINGYIFNNIFEGKETGVALSGGLSKNLNKFQIGANGLLDFTTSKDFAYSLDNHIFKVNPFIKLDGEKFKLTAGINYIAEFGTNSNSNLFPNASIDFSLVKNYLGLFAKLDGNVNKTRLKDLSYVNPFINENIDIRNQIEKFNISGGIKGTLAANIGYKAYISYKNIDNFAYFVNDTTRRETFNLEYESGNTSVFGITGELNIKFSDIARIDSKLELNQYTLKHELNAWQHPSAKLTTNASFKIAKKVKLDADLYFQGPTKAKLYEPDPTSSTVPAPLIGNIKTLKSFADLGVGAEYLYNKRISAFLRVNNLFNSDYQRYLYYPSYGFNILGGISYGF